MQEEEVSAGKPFCGRLGLAEGEEGKGVTGGKEGTKEGRSSQNCVQEGRAPHSTGGKS